MTILGAYFFISLPRNYNYYFLQRTGGLEW